MIIQMIRIHVMICRYNEFLERDVEVKGIYDERMDPQTIELSLINNGIGDEGATALAHALKRNSALQQLSYGSHHWSEGCQQVLVIHNNTIGVEGSTAIAEALKHNSSLQQLNLENNTIGEEGVSPLAEALKQNSTLQELDLKNNAIGEEGARAMAEALKHNSALKNLSLENNAIGEEGARALAEALATNSSLQRLGIHDDNISLALLRRIYNLLSKKNREKRRLELETESRESSDPSCSRQRCTK
jgi:Ran GTPase-activating protein (RanGAP) involved in mRNA processing and transport